MHARLIVNKVIEYIDKRKLNFCLTLIILTVAIYMSFFVSVMVCESNYHIYKTKNMIKGNIVNINVIMDGLNTFYCSNVSEFEEELRDLYGDNFGKFMYMDTHYTVDGEEVVIPTLYMDASITDLCDEDKTNCEADFHDEEQYAEGYAGFNLTEKYPHGTELTDSHTGRKMKLVKSLPKESEWLPDLLFHTRDAAVRLDDYIVTTMDEGYFGLSEDFLSNTFNSWYIQYESDAEEQLIRQTIRDLAEEYGITCYAYTTDELISMERTENKALMDSLGILLLFTVAIAILAYISAALADVYSRRRELAIMYVNKVSITDIFAMFLSENIIKFVISTGVASFLFVRDLTEQQAMIYRTMVLPIAILLFALFVIVLSVMSCLTINKKKILSLIGGART